MIKSWRNLIAWSSLVLGGAGLAGCAGNLEGALDEVLPTKQPKYESSRSLPPLEIPPDLSSAAVQDALVVPGEDSLGSATYSQYATAAQAPGTAAASALLPQSTDVRVERSGDKRWLVVKAPPEKVWPRVREFWLEGGMVLKMENPSIGIMETDWAENRSNIPEGFIRRFLERVSTRLYASTTRDKFRTRLERAAEPGSTEVYVSHRGAEEVAQGETTKWQPRPSDPELEAEMLNRMLVFFGATREGAERMLARAPTREERARMMRNSDGLTTLALDEDFSRAWRRTGLALDRVGFTVEDRDRSRGVYYVRYVDPLKDIGEDAEKGWLSKLKFWGDDDQKEGPESYLINLVESGGATEVVVLNAAGERENSPTAERILSLLHEQLK